MAIQKISDIDKGSIQAVEGIAKTSIEAMDGITANFVTYPARTGMHNVGNEGGDPIQIGYSVVVYDSAADRLVWAFEKQSTVNAGTNNKGYILTSPVFYNPDDWGGGTVSNSADVYEPTPAGQLIHSQDVRPLAMGFDESTGVCMVVYQNYDDSKTYLQPFTVNTSTYAITLGTLNEVSSSLYTEAELMYDSTMDRWTLIFTDSASPTVVSYKRISVTSASSGGAVEHADVITVWGTSDATGAGGTAVGRRGALAYCKGVGTAGDRIVAAGEYNGYGSLRAGTPDSDSWNYSTDQHPITWGDVLQVGSSFHDMTVQWNDTDDYGLVLYQNASNVLKCRAFTIDTSDNSIDLQGSETTVYGGTVSDFSQLIYNADSAAKNFIAQYVRTHSSSNRGHFKQITVDKSDSYSITVGSEIRWADLAVDMDPDSTTPTGSPITRFKGAFVAQPNQNGIIMMATEGGSGGSAGRLYAVWIAYTDDGTYERYTA